MTLPYRETTLRGLLGLVYPHSRGIQVVDQYTLLGLVYVESLTSSVSAEILVVPAVRAGVKVNPAVDARIELTARKP